MQASESIDPVAPPDWMKALARLERDFANRFQRPLKVLDALTAHDRALFRREHPEHAWFGFLREDWMEGVTSEPLLERLH